MTISFDRFAESAKLPLMDSDKKEGVIVHVFGKTDVGLVREHNEDNFLVADLSRKNRSIKPEVRTHQLGHRGSLFVVCDGMGGAAAGEVASQIGVDSIYEVMQEADPAVDDFVLARRLDGAVCEAGRRIFEAANKNKGQRGMGTTVTAAALRDSRLIIGQVGDSRAYIARRGELVQVTKDQSLVQQLIDAKQLTQEEAKTFDRNNIILQALGTTSEVHVDVTSVNLRRGDVLIMCSDGLSGFVDSDQILDAALQHKEPMDVCRTLIEMACDGGGDDNITVITARFEGERLKEPQDEDVVKYEKFEFPKLTETTARASVPKFEDEQTQKNKKLAEGKEKIESGDSNGGIDNPNTKENKTGLIITVLVVLLFAGGLAGYFLLSGNDPDQLTTVPLSDVAKPQTPASEPDRIEEPKLAPTDVRDIEGLKNNEKTLVSAPEQELTKALAPKAKPRPKPKQLDNAKPKPSRSVEKKEPALKEPESAPKGSDDNNKKKSPIVENPYGD